jgi:hypothetical protein
MASAQPEIASRVGFDQGQAIDLFVRRSRLSSLMRKSPDAE